MDRTFIPLQIYNYFEYGSSLLMDYEDIVLVRNKQKETGDKNMRKQKNFRFRPFVSRN